MIGIKKSIEYGEHTLSLETGIIAKQANSAVTVTLGDTVVLVTVVGSTHPSEQTFFPLRVDYQEKAYAAGKIPGGFFKREGRPSERETLISRLIDRPIRPLFPKGFNQDVQVIAAVLSIDPEVDPDIPALIGASAALYLSGLPITEPFAAARVSYSDGKYILNPSPAKCKTYDLDLVVAGTQASVLMVESEANELSEEVMLGAVVFGHRAFGPVIELIKSLGAETRKPLWEFSEAKVNETLLKDLKAYAEAELMAGYHIQDKLERRVYIQGIVAKTIEHFSNEDTTAHDITEIKALLEKIERQLVRNNILAGKPRIDGRDIKTVRPIDIRTNILPRTHGSALFTRGETQALVAVTLGTGRDAQIIDSLLGEHKDNFMLHYNFPPYSVGELGNVGSPKRREIGHGKLAKRALSSQIPSMEEFPYVIRLVSEITESNGSSSMASVCGGSLAMMSAGVPLKSAVAGIAMGLVKEGDKFAVLTDILGDEDHLGDMDFKVAGTKTGVTALQMDIKISGINKDIMHKALEQAKEGRMHILGIMNKALNTYKSEMSAYAPRIISFKINPEKIRDVIGKGGATIRALTEESGTTIEIQDDGTVQIASNDQAASDDVRCKIEQLTAEIEVDQIYEGKIVRLADFGAFVNLLPGKDGLLHISQIYHRRVENVYDELSEGQVVRVKVMEVDRQGKVRLSMKALSDQDEEFDNNSN